MAKMTPKLVDLGDVLDEAARQFREAFVAWWAEYLRLRAGSGAGPSQLVATSIPERIFLGSVMAGTILRSRRGSTADKSRTFRSTSIEWHAQMTAAKQKERASA
jgi:hypothetical protein